MSILETFVASIEEDTLIEEVSFGPFWTAVLSKNCGLSSTTVDCGKNQSYKPVMEAESLKGKSTLELCQLLKRKNHLKKSLGLAA